MFDIIIKVIPETVKDINLTIRKFLKLTYGAFMIAVVCEDEIKDLLMQEFKDSKGLRFLSDTGIYGKDLNNAIDTGGSEYIVITTGGVEVEGDWTSGITREMKWKEVGGITPRLIGINGHIAFTGVIDPLQGNKGIRGWDTSDRKGVYDIKEDCVSIIDDFMVIKRDAYNKAGPFAETYTKFFIDHDWCFRLRQRTAYRTFYAPYARYIIRSGKLFSYGDEIWKQDREVFTKTFKSSQIVEVI